MREMREIEFRAKCGFRDGWAYGFYSPIIWYPSNEQTPSIKELTGGDVQIKPETLGQYTGFKDKNGQRVFEGDIFEIEENEAIGVVVFEKGAYRIKIYGYREVLYEYGYDTGSWDYLTTEDFDMYYIDQMEVIGNIYDNPELLKGE